LQTGSGLPDFQSLTNWNGIGFSEKSENAGPFLFDLDVERPYHIPYFQAIEHSTPGFQKNLKAFSKN